MQNLLKEKAMRGKQRQKKNKLGVESVSMGMSMLGGQLNYAQKKPHIMFVRT